MRRFAVTSIFLVLFSMCRSETPEIELETQSVTPGIESETQSVTAELESETSGQPTSESKKKKNKNSTRDDFNLEFKVIEHTIPITERQTTSPKPTKPYVRRQKILNEDYIFPREGIEDPYSATLFYNFTGLEVKRLVRKSGKRINESIKKRNFRAFIREMDIYVRKIPFEELSRDRDNNADGLYHRAGFYLLLRAFGYTPTTYFHDIWKKHGVLAVETEPTVFLFAVDLYSEAEANFNVTETIVEGPSGTVLPRDTKTILCAGITFDRDFDCKIRHWKAVLRDKTLLKPKQNATTTADR